MASIVIDNNTTNTTTTATTLSALIPPSVPVNFSSMVTLFRNMTPSATEPADPVEGYVYLDTGANTASGTMGFRRYTGSAWTDFGLQSVAETISLADLDDVTISTVVNGERLVYDAVSGVWENTGTIDGGLFSD